MNRREISSTLLTGAAVLPLCSGWLMTRRAAAAPTAHKLTVLSRTLDIDGKPATVYGLTGPQGKPGLTLTASEAAEVDLVNSLGEETMIHWHGLKPAWNHDGVPGQPMPMLKPGEVRRYQLPAGKPGTHWMHAHTLQEQALLAAPLIVHGAEDATRDEQEIVVLLHDFSFTPAEELLARLKTGGGMGMMDHMHMPGMGQSQMPRMGQGQMGGMMMGGMMGMDVNDVEYDAYLANDRTLNDPEVHLVERGGRVRLRLINGATATGFTIDPGPLAGEIVAVDGQDIVPIPARPFPLAMGQRVDYRLNIPAEGGSFPILARREGAVERTGIILATAGAAVGRFAVTGEAKGPILALGQETGLAAAVPLPDRAIDRRFVVNLFGSMEGYAWGMEADRELKVRQGERIAIEMRNHSMMMHPMHLHGHHFQITGVNGRAIAGAVRDTVFLTPMSRVTFAFDADNPGGAWAFHCHHLYHMASGMMAAIGYEGA